MWKLIILLLTVDICMLFNFSRSESVDNIDIQNINTIETSLEEKGNLTTTTPTTTTAQTTTTTPSTTTPSISTTRPTHISTSKQEQNSTSSQQPNADEDTTIVDDIIKQISLKYPEATQQVNSTLRNIVSKDPSVILEIIGKPNVTLEEIQSTINQTALEIEVKKTQEFANNDLFTLVAKHHAESILRDANNAMANTPLSALTNATTSIIKSNLNSTTFNLTKLLDPNYNPSLYIKRLKAPWKHVLEKHEDNETEVVQVCRFEMLTASCSAEYTSWNSKVWFELSEAPGRNGINITAYTTGHVPKATFNHIVNGTHCSGVEDLRVHHICAKVYGYEKDVGPTRFCLQMASAISNFGVASSDYGCFRFVSSVIHEDPMDNETPHPRILMSHMLNLNVNTYRNNTGTLSFQPSIVMPMLTVATTLLYLRY